MPTASPPALLESSLHSLRLLARGKVRDNYAVGDDRLLMVASDRLSAFDVVLGQPIPGKGELLTQMALFWFARLGHVVPNHLTGGDPESVVAADERHQVRGRSMLVKRLKPLPVEAVVRGYLAGSGWKEYQHSQSVCGVALPAGLRNASRLPEPIFTPATKAEMGDHDENISFEHMSRIIGSALAAQVRAVSRPTRRAASSKLMFSSWSPSAALVAGVKIGAGSFAALTSPAGKATPHTAWLRWYSTQPLPAR